MKQPAAARRLGVVVFLLFALFAVSILLVLMLGADSYHALVQRDADAYRCRTGAQYVSAKVRSLDALDSVAVEEFSLACPLPCIALYQTIDGAEYVTRIYCWDGYLRELFCDAALDMAPEAGHEILPASALTAALEDGLLTVTVTDTAGETAQLALSLRSGEVGA